MTFKDLKNKALKDYYPALLLERIVHHRSRMRIIRLAWGLLAFTFVLLLAWYGLAGIHTSSYLTSLHLAASLPDIYGIFFIILGFWMFVFSFQSFHNSFYFKDIADDEKDIPNISFELARILYRSDEKDLVASFLKSKEGIQIMMRAGISAEEVGRFLGSRTTFLNENTFVFSSPEAGKISLTDYVAELYNQDEAFAKFLFSFGIQKDDIRGIAEWISEREKALKHRLRFWSKERLGRIPGIGKNWAYGTTFYLDEYCRDIPYAAPEYETHSIYGTKELKELEAILVKSKGANVFLVGNDNDEQLDIIARLNRIIEDGTSLPELEHKRIALLDTELLASTAHTKADLETKLLQLFHEAEYAGNIILILENFSALMQSAEALTSDIVTLLDQYFTSPHLHCIGLCDIDHFHSKIEPNILLKQRFDRILMDDIDETNTIKVLENEIISLENSYHLLFTYPALVALAEGAVRYFPDALMPEKAIDLVSELAPWEKEHGRNVVTKEDVLELITTKTGMPVGEIKEGERDSLLNLEKLLHQRIVGQDEAVTAIANAVRRARAGINNPHRPLASFLFLGPTGVGKTESTKALAEIFFGTEVKIERLDMSEYTSDNALEKLIGSSASGKQGILGTMLRERPYGVLLLDEFEKTTPEVRNLFLQILDEGSFSDMEGKHVNARNLLIIATSNAGAEIIWEGLKVGDDFSQAKEYIIDAIIKAGTFQPELINRFDGVIVFHPLGKHELEKVAALQLNTLKKRLAERGVNLVVNDELIKYVVTFGTDPKFGARPMNRAIQDKVEQAVAEKMIRSGVKKGQEITLSFAELTT